MRPPARVLCPLALALAAIVPSTALAADPPVITKISPLKAKVGEELTLRGRNFRAGKRVNTVIFQSPKARVVFVRAATATRTRIKVRIPSDVAAFMTRKGDTLVGTRFRLRVLATRAGRRYTSAPRSPVISPAEGAETPGTPTPTAPAAPAPAPSDCDRDGTPDAQDGDDDNDLLDDAREVELRLAPCTADTDGDGVEDGFEYFSALDLNSVARPLPYPGTRSYPNPLDPTDAKDDYDSDGLLMSEEFALWVVFGGHALPLSYSDGNQRTAGDLAPAPGMAYLDLDGDGILSDDERDGDGDGLGNWDEIRGRLALSWWSGDLYADVNGKVYPVKFVQPSYLDRDTDGDDDDTACVLPPPNPSASLDRCDGADDQDHDGVSNVDEVRPPYELLGGQYQPDANRHPFNPCRPNFNAPTCALHGIAP